MNKIFVNLPLFLMFAIFVVLVAVLYSYQKYNRLKKRPSPFTQNFLRSPGETLRSQLDSINAEINICLVCVFILPLATYSTYISYSYFRGVRLNTVENWMGLTISLAVVAYFIFKLIKLLSQRRIIRLGYEGEVAVAQELNQLMLSGYHVYHDFPAEKSNIDHIVVGPKGVFAVATKTRSKRTPPSRVEDEIVTYDGKMLFFPKGSDFQIIDQAQRQAFWLSNWLSHAVGEPLAARAIVALPGWYVKRTSADGIPVVNPKQFSSLFEHIKPRALSETTITRITHQLEQKCRDVGPKSMG